MSARRRRSRRGGRRRGKAGRGWPRRLAWRAAVAALLLLAAWTAWLDLRIRSEFEGRRWELPARVYARALELYPGAPVGRRALLDELARLGYVRAAGARRPGSYAVAGEAVLLHTRRFRFWDGEEPARRVRVRFAAGRVAALEAAAGGRAPALVRLDPVLVGKFYPRHHEDRVLIRLQDAPRLLVDALVAVEDRGFWRHHGVDPRAVLRALWADIRARALVQGGSTLTQQLVKNFFLGSERTLRRKATEAVMALLLELHYGKEEILEAYLNEVYLGQDGRRAIHGFGLASHFYFGRPLSELDLPRIALLVGLVKGPSYYDPRRHPERARRRRNVVLGVLAERGVISRAEAARARRAPLGVVPQPPALAEYPAFMDLVRRQLAREYREEDLRTQGLRIFTTLDPLLQAAAERALTRGIAALERGHGLPRGSLQGAVVVLDAGTGEALAVVGGRAPRFAGFNRALDARRPVGSLVKPAVYLAALVHPRRWTLATLVEDDPLEVRLDDGKVWAPRNYDERFRGPVPLYRALAESLNVPTARVGLAVGVPAVVDTLRRLGVGRPLRPYPALLLGAVSLSPLEVARMYLTLAGGGFHTPVRATRAVLTAAGEPLSRYPLETEPALDPRVVFLVDHALQRAVREGTGRGLAAYLPVAALGVAGKTGTTDDLRDSWFAGFTGNRVAVVWLGRDDNAPVGLSGAAGALQVWGLLMRALAPTLEPFAPVEPEGIEWVRVDPETGLRADSGCTGSVELPFIAGSAPAERAPCAGAPNPLRWLRRIFE